MKRGFTKESMFINLKKSNKSGYESGYTPAYEENYGEKSYYGGSMLLTIIITFTKLLHTVRNKSLLIKSQVQKTVHKILSLYL